MINRYKNKIAIVTGASSGIGKEISRLLVKKGATVILTSRNLKRTKAAALECDRNCGKIEYEKLDVTKVADFKRVFSKVLKKHKRIDYFFNIAGIQLYGEVRDMQLSDWKKAFDVDLWGCINGTHTIYPIMVKQGFGHIVNMASMAGLLPLPLSSAYCAAKHAVVGLTRVTRLEGADLGVKASVVCPGFIDTPIYDKATVINYGRNVMIPKEFRLMPPERAARIILREVQKNKETIIVSYSKERMLHLLYKDFPSLYSLIVLRLLRKARKFRKK